MEWTGTAKKELDIPSLCYAIGKNSPMPLAAVDGADYVIRYANPAFCVLTGKTETELIGSAFAEVVPSGGACVSFLDRVYSSGEPETYIRQEELVKHPYYWSYVMWPILTEDRRSLGIIIQVTEAMQSHQQATAINQALLLSSIRQHELTDAAENLSAQLQREIIQKENTQEALIQSEKLATAGAMAATLAHELNNPLESLTNLIYLAKRDPALPASALELLDAAEEELMRVAHMTKQTLGLYRENSARAPVLVSELLKDLLVIFSSKINNKRIEMALEIASELEVIAVAGELRQIFANLLGNSIDAVGTNGLIRIRVSKVTHGLICGMRITIADNGPGIPRENRQKIFQPFFTTKVTIGTGLGLWVSKQIVRRYKGSLNLRSRTRPPATGTAVSVFLPQGERRVDPVSRTSSDRVT